MLAYAPETKGITCDARVAVCHERIDTRKTGSEKKAGSYVAVIFPRWTNTLPKLVVAGLGLGGAGLVFAIFYWFSPEFTDVGYEPAQPVPFSHKLHAGDLGLDCRYCHNTVETTSHAAVPPTATCMNCHQAIKADSEDLKLVRDSYANNEPIEWVNVHMLPDYAFFDHSAHVAAGVGCVSCHGRVDQMDVVKQVEPLSMGWCLSCHRDPTPNLRPRDQVTNMAYDGEAESYNVATDPHRTREVNPPENCSGCHL